MGTIREAVEGGQYQPLPESAMRAIHEASLQVLARTGIDVPHAEALERFRQAGAQVEGRRVRLSPTQVEDALAAAPKSILLASLGGHHDLWLAGRRVHFGTGGSPGAILDEGAVEARPATLRDVARLAALADALEGIDFFVLPVTPGDIPSQVLAVGRFYAALRHTTRHVMGGLIDLQGARDVLELGVTLAGSLAALQERPFISAITSWMVSPLTFDPVVTDILTFWCEQGLPVALSSAPMAGSTAPVTLAGTLVQLNAEQLAGVVYTQLVRRGAPILAGYIPGQMNLCSGGYLSGTAEFGLMQAAAAQLAQFYGLPIYCSAGMSDAKLPDAQAGYEKMATLLLTAMSGASYIHHAAGLIENMNAVSYEQMALDNDIILMVKRVLQGLQVDAERLAVGAIDRVGPGGHYLLDQHTLTYMRSEFAIPPLADRRSRAAWLAQGAPDARKRAAQRVQDILQHSPSSLLPAEVDKALAHRWGLEAGL